MRSLLRRGAEQRLSRRAMPFMLAFLFATGLAPRSASAQTRELTVVGEVRVRAELRDNADFDDATSDRQRFFGQRTRLGVDARVNPKITGRVILQDTRFWGQEPSTESTASELASIDLLEGYLDLRWIWDLPLDLRLGRQPLTYGRERLVGRHEWSNHSRVFDAYKLHFGLGAFYLDILGAKLVDTNLPEGTGQSDQDRNFSGLYFSKEGDRLELLDLYWLRLIDKTDPPAGEVYRSTFGALGRYLVLDDLTLEIEYAHQLGEASSELDIGAYMLAARLGWQSRGPRELHAAAGFDLASGDANGTADGTLQTFDQLFPSPHRHLGAMDLIGRQNSRDWWARVGARLTSSLRGRLDGHVLGLDKAEDAWYAADGTPGGPGGRFTAGSGRRERHLGVELDLVFDFDFAEDSAVQFGVSRFLAGAALREGGAPDDDATFAYGSVRIDL